MSAHRTGRGRAFLAAAVLSVAGLGACSADTPGGTDELVAFGDCAEYADHLARLTSGQEPRDPYTSQPPKPEHSDVPGRVTGTAVQPSSAVDVNPPDLLATDGRDVFLTTGDKIRIFDFSGPAPAKRSALPLRHPGELLLAGNRLLTVGHVYAEAGPPQSRLSLVDVSDRDHPTLVQEHVVGGQVVSAGLSNGIVRVVFSTVPDETHGWLPTREITDAAGKPVEVGPLLACTDIRRPADESGSDLLTVVSIDPARDDAFVAGSSVGIVAGGDIVAASASRLFVASTPDWDAAPPTDQATAPPAGVRSQIHAFDTTRPATTYLSSTTVENHVAGAAGMSARGGVLRVVSSNFPGWWFDPGAKTAREYAVSTVGEQDGHLMPFGSTPVDVPARPLGVIRWFDDLLALAPRFDGELAILLGNHSNSVYNRMSGPLRLVDLSDSYAPRDAATLDLPVDTAELRPVGNGRLVTVGNSEGGADLAAGTPVSPPSTSATRPRRGSSTRSASATARFTLALSSGPNNASSWPWVPRSSAAGACRRSPAPPRNRTCATSPAAVRTTTFKASWQRA